MLAMQMFTVLWRPLLLVAIAALGLLPAHGESLVRIGTVAPGGSSFHKRLLALATEWRSGPEPVGMDIFAGTQGGEVQIVRRMRVGQLQGGMLTSIGLGQIDPAVNALQMLPLMFRDWNEVDVVRDQLAPLLEEKLHSAGYVVLFWGDAGWVRFFAKTRVSTVGDLRPLRIYASSGDTTGVELMKRYYNPVVLEPDQILLALRNGMIDAVPIPAFLANFSQVAAYAPFMIDLRWAPVTGAFVITNKTWDTFSPATQARLRETSVRAGIEMRRASRAEDQQAIHAMEQKQKLQVVTLDPANELQWRHAVETIYPELRGKVVPVAMYDRVVQTLRQYRDTHP
jgi:TRAP-type C4-dicarboxylate transport system substrate-binding protein